MAKPQLHQSMLSMLYRCGEQFRRRYGSLFGWNDKEEIIAPGIALLIGKATHKSIEANLTQKIQDGTLLDLEAVKAIARDEISGLWQEDVRLDDDESENVEKAKGDSIDTVVSLAALHACELAPIIQPKSVERKWVIELKDYPIDLAGTWDIEEITGSIRDTKTAGKAPSQNDADSSEQLSMYAMAMEVCEGHAPEKLYLDALVKTKTPKVITLETSRNEFHRRILLNRIERFIEIVNKGAFTPANQSDWICSRKWCGFSTTCRYWSGR